VSGAYEVVTGTLALAARHPDVLDELSRPAVLRGRPA
jgi:hypothetical protein